MNRGLLTYFNRFFYKTFWCILRVAVAEAAVLGSIILTSFATFLLDFSFWRYQ